MKTNAVENEFKVCIKIIKFLLYWPNESSNFKNIAHKILCIFKIAITNYLYFFVQCITIYKTSSNISDILDSTLFMMLSIVNYFVKVICYTGYDGKLKSILEETEKDIFYPIDAKSKEIMMRTMRIWKIIFQFYMTTCISVVSLWAGCALLTSNDIALPFTYWYPFDVTSSPVYEIIFAYEVLGILLMVIGHVTLDVSVAGIMAFIIGQINILNDNLRNIDCEDEVAIKTQIRCFILHRNIKRLVSKLNEMLVFPMFVQSTLGAAILCTAMYKLSKVPLLSGQGLSYIAYYLAMITQLSLHFWYGNEVIAKALINIHFVYFCFLLRYSQ